MVHQLDRRLHIAFPQGFIALRLDQMKGVLFSVKIIGIDPYRSLRGVGKGLLGLANSFPMQVFNPFLVPSPVEATVAEPADDEVDVTVKSFS